MTKYELIRDISTETGMGQFEVKRIVQLTLEGITTVLVSQGRIELRNFGIFDIKVRKARKARNPRTGEIVHVPAKNVVCFKPGKLMEEKILATSTTPQSDV